jgi:prophage tail gpP-like protein
MPSDELRIRLKGREFAGFWDAKITRHLDSYGTIGFAAPFEPEHQEFRETFRPFEYAPVEAFIGDTRILSGRMVDIAPSMAPGARTVGVSGYAGPGLLTDTNLPASEWPLEFNGLTLDRIAERIAAPYGLQAVVEDGIADVGPAFRRVALEANESPQTFLAELARQRSFVLADDPSGALLIRRSVAVSSPAVARFVEGEPPLSEVSVQFNPREYFTEITALGGTRPGRSGGPSTERNPFASDVVRPHIYQPDDTETGDLGVAARAQLGRMFGNAATYELPLPTWRDPAGDLWAPNTVVELHAPGAMVYRPTRLIVRSVTFEGTPSSRTATLGLVLPGAFSGDVPEALPWAA